MISRIARSPDAFAAWKIRAKVLFTHSLSPEALSNFEELTSTGSVPYCIKELSMPQTKLKHELMFQNALKDLADPNVTTDPYDLSHVLPWLSMAYARMLQTSGNSSYKFSQRRGVDDMIELAFSIRDDAICQFLYALPMLRRFSSN